ncbi:MAG TPA: hypothetical protein VKG05_12265, partial [Steroidobacteraceae bacterium]|nr:hypothetical protein [Steroidobacteraceae bacterium]
RQVCRLLQASSSGLTLAAGDCKYWFFLGRAASPRNSSARRRRGAPARRDLRGGAVWDDLIELPNVGEALNGERITEMPDAIEIERRIVIVDDIRRSEDPGNIGLERLNRRRARIAGRIRQSRTRARRSRRTR